MITIKIYRYALELCKMDSSLKPNPLYKNAIDKNLLALDTYRSAETVASILKIVNRNGHHIPLSSEYNIAIVNEIESFYWKSKKLTKTKRGRKKLLKIGYELEPIWFRKLKCLICITSSSKNVCNLLSTFKVHKESVLLHQHVNHSLNRSIDPNEKQRVEHILNKIKYFLSVELKLSKIK